MAPSRTRRGDVAGSRPGLGARSSRGSRTRQDEGHGRRHHAPPGQAVAGGQAFSRVVEVVHRPRFLDLDRAACSGGGAGLIGTVRHRRGGPAGEQRDAGGGARCRACRPRRRGGRARAGARGRRTRAGRGLARAAARARGGGRGGAWANLEVGAAARHQGGGCRRDGHRQRAAAQLMEIMKAPRGRVRNGGADPPPKHRSRAAPLTRTPVWPPWSLAVVIHGNLRGAPRICCSRSCCPFGQRRTLRPNTGPPPAQTGPRCPHSRRRSPRRAGQPGRCLRPRPPGPGRPVAAPRPTAAP